MVVVAIGPDAQKPKYRQVLQDIGGQNVFYTADYDTLDEAVGTITEIICRKY